MLHRQKIDFEVIEVPFGDIDREAGLKNHARISQALDQETVMNYALAMERGDTFPMVVLNRQKREGKWRLVPISGNHRLAGYAEIIDQQERIRAYSVQIEDEMVSDLLPRMLNNQHGKGIKKDELVEHALYAMRAYSVTREAAEAMFALPKGMLSREMAVAHARKLMTEARVNVSKMPKGILAALAGLKNENVMRAAGSVFAQHNTNGDTVTEILREVRSSTTESAQIAVLAAYENSLKVEDRPQKGTVVRPVRRNLLQHLTGMERLLTGRSSAKQMQITEPSDKKEIYDRFKRITEKMRVIFGN